MLKSSFLFGLFSFFVLFIHRANGLECFVCSPFKAGGTIEMSEDDNFDDNGVFQFEYCAGEKVKFTQTCDDGGGLYDVSCGKVVVSGNVTMFDGKEERYNATVRGCFKTSQTMPKDWCVLDQSPLQLANNTDVPNEIKPDPSDFPPNSEISICSCKRDRCNSGLKLTVTHGLFMLSLACFFQSFIGLV